MRRRQIVSGGIRFWGGDTDVTPALREQYDDYVIDFMANDSGDWLACCAIESEKRH